MSLSRLEHFKSSLDSFEAVSDDWRINIRGTFREEAIAYLKEKLGERLTLFELLDDSRGWLTNALDMLKEAKHEYVLVWNEDHMNIAPLDVLKKTIEEMEIHRVDYLLYSWWMFGKARKAFDEVREEIGLVDDSHISFVRLTADSWRKVRYVGYRYFLISMCGIFRKEFLQEMWEEDRHRLPFWIKKTIFKILGALTKIGFPKVGHKELFDRINRHIFFNKVRKYPAVTPFEMEKNPERFDVLPFVIALPRQELFACIDDNLKEPGYSLVDRGMYRSHKDITDTKVHVDNIISEIKTVLSKVDQQQVDTLVRHILSSKRIIASGAGRVGMAIRGFVMRLKHLGIDAYILGDANVPALRQDDLFLVCSGSGETQTIYELVAIAKRNEARIALVTGNPESRMGKLASTIVEIKAPSKVKQVEGFVSIQPMTTLNEQSIAIFFDALVLRLMQELGETHETMWARHSNLE